MSIKPAKRARMLERDQDRCVVCGWDARNDPEKRRRLTAGHIMPSSQGGKDALDNIQAECRQCNSSKGNTLPSALNPDGLGRTWRNPHPHRVGRPGLFRNIRKAPAKSKRRRNPAGPALVIRDLLRRHDSCPAPGRAIELIAQDRS